MKMKMMMLKYKKIVLAASFAFAGASLAGGARAQAPAGPLQGAPPAQGAPTNAQPREVKPAVKPRSSILGAWKLNRDESDDARKRLQDARGADGGRGGGGGRGGVRMGIPGMGGGPYGGGRRGGGENESDADRQKMQDYMNPTRALTVAEAKKDVEIDMFDDQEKKSAFYTDGRKLQKTKDNTTQEIAARWDGNRLVTDEKSPSGRKISRTYELSYDGTQLYETLSLARGRSGGTVSIRYVYDQADARPASSPQTR